ncbi:uncharacterized protein K441DRAFT_288039 [Cenococcum geophilum 1.58]|uniref:uncharacterized protein n=1 Tax=Cenococcum geophilum 1.58 TaxID=794803 RepID=UPI00358F5D4B|nr:hypothetical protein K441DRAFT_288039 [Cenococcum geophilum 1.58]
MAVLRRKLPHRTQPTPISLPQHHQIPQALQPFHRPPRSTHPLNLISAPILAPPPAYPRSPNPTPAPAPRRAAASGLLTSSRGRGRGRGLRHAGHDATIPVQRARRRGGGGGAAAA